MNQMNTTTKKVTVKKISLVNLSLAIVVNNYIAIKTSLNNLLSLLDSKLDFINLSPHLNYIKTSLKNLSIHVYHSKNKKIILVQLESLKANYPKLDSSIWSKFSKKFFTENKKDNTGYFQAVFNLYNSEKKFNEKFLMELLIVRNNSSIKDFQEIKSFMFSSKQVNIKWNKNGLYINEYLKPFLHLNSVDFDLLENLSNKSKSYINPHLCYFLKTIGYSLMGEKMESEKIQIKNEKKDIKKIVKKTISKKVIKANNKLLKVSKKHDKIIDKQIKKDNKKN